MILNIIYVILGFFGVISLFFIILITTQKHRHKTKLRKTNLARNYVFKKYFDNEDIKLPVSKTFFLKALIDIDEQVQLEESVRDRIIADLLDHKFLRKQLKRLSSRRRHYRLLAVFYLGRLKQKDITYRIFERFKVEKNETIKLSMIPHFSILNDQEIYPLFFNDLYQKNDIYHERMCTLLSNHLRGIYEILPEYHKDLRYHIVLAISRMGKFFADEFLLNYMQEKLTWIVTNHPYNETRNQKIKDILIKNLSKHIPTLFNDKNLIYHQDASIKKAAILSLAFKPQISCVNLLIDDIDDSEFDEQRIKTLSKILLVEKSYIEHIIRIYHHLSSLQKSKIIYVLAERIDYIILYLIRNNQNLLKEIIHQMMIQNIIEPLIDFLNLNQDIEIENTMVEIIKPILSKHIELTKSFRTYLNTRVLAAFGMQKLDFEVIPKEKAPKEKDKIKWIIKWLLFIHLLFPIIYIIRYNISLLDMSFKTIIETFLIDVNIYLIFYFALINIVYIILFLFALSGSKRQTDLAKTKPYTILFTDQLLPGISIIAPAYNEEVSIIDSVTSLLNLKYPDYEVVVVNDGSKDQTLLRLIEHFELERKHPSFVKALNTKDIRGVYQAKDIPNLVVVDKHNGGKADALNVGINVSKKPYVCGIDADSILEGDALLKIASVMLDDTKETIAVGGNIYPANGFIFDKGQVEKRSIPKEMLCRFQTIEYLRAFTSGRIGWSEIKSLMIISGAFGLFHKGELIKAGGYLTSSGSFKKDTVGEDMELVVRLTMQALKEKKPYLVSYVHNAYCYTELPSDLKTLLKQRNRWQRGLIDILSFHRDIAFKKDYKQIGFIGYPYFFVFEFLGPFLEMQGYIMLGVALILGLLNPVILLGIFTASIAFGVVISLSSFYMSEKEMLMMSQKDMYKLLFYAIFENFGYRQMISMHRAISSFKALRESGQWGTQKRKGFNK